MIAKHLTLNIDIYNDLLLIIFHLLSILLHCAYCQISDYEIYTTKKTNMIAKRIILSNTISVVSDGKAQWKNLRLF